MATVKDILAGKGTQVLSISPKATVMDAARLMNEHKIGGLVVLRDGKAAGMFTERDILQRVVAEELDPAKTAVKDVMSTRITTCRIETTIDEARVLMRNRRVRHLPVVDAQKKLLGLVSIGDLNAYLLVEEQKANHFLQEYLYGRA